MTNLKYIEQCLEQTSHLRDAVMMVVMVVVHVHQPLWNVRGQACKSVCHYSYGYLPGVSVCLVPSPRLAWCQDIAGLLCPGNRACTDEAWARNLLGEAKGFLGVYRKRKAIGLPVPFPSSLGSSCTGLWHVD